MKGGCVKGSLRSCERRNTEFIFKDGCFFSTELNTPYLRPNSPSTCDFWKDLWKGVYDHAKGSSSCDREYKAYEWEDIRKKEYGLIFSQAVIPFIRSIYRIRPSTGRIPAFCIMGYTVSKREYSTKGRVFNQRAKTVYKRTNTAYMACDKGYTALWKSIRACERYYKACEKRNTYFIFNDEFFFSDSRILSFIRPNSPLTQARIGLLKGVNDLTDGSMIAF